MSNTFLVQKNQVEKKFGPKQCLATKFKVQRNFEISNQNKFWQKKISRQLTTHTDCLINQVWSKCD